ncbi:hypothetical protein V6N13_053282 [Hibiscus sabdariffa]
MAASLFTKSDQFLVLILLIAGCKDAVLRLHHMVKKRILHFEECMIQVFCETMWLQRKDSESAKAAEQAPVEIPAEAGEENTKWIAI